MIFLRIGNGQNLLVLQGPHDVIGNPNEGCWAIKRWGSEIGALVIGGVASDTLPSREYESAGIIPPLGTIGVIVSWNKEKSRADETLLLSTIERTSFRYKDIVVSMDREAVRVSGFKQEWHFEVGYSQTVPAQVSHFFSPNGIVEPLRSLDHVRVSMQRRMFGDFIDRRGSGTLW